MNGVLRRFQQYFSHITATVHIIHVFSGFHQYRQSTYLRGVPVFEPQVISDFSCISWCKWRHNFWEIIHLKVNNSFSVVDLQNTIKTRQYACF